MKKLNTIYENNEQQCCKDLEKMKDQFTKLLIASGNHNIQTRNAFKNINLKRNILKLGEFGFNKAAAKNILKYYAKRNMNVPMNENYLKSFFTKKGTVRKRKIKLINNN